MNENAVKLKGNEFCPVPGFPLSVVPVNAEVASLENFCGMYTYLGYAKVKDFLDK